MGDVTTAAVIYARQLAGYSISIPFGENVRYDLVADNRVRLARVQCKTGRIRAGAVTFKVASSYAHHPNPKLVKRDYVGEVDHFAVFCRETREVFLVPIEDVGARCECALRIEPPKNNQVRRVRFASDYLIAKVPDFRVVLTTKHPRTLLKPL